VDFPCPFGFYILFREVSNYGHFLETKGNKAMLRKVGTKLRKQETYIKKKMHKLQRRKPIINNLIHLG